MELGTTTGMALCVRRNVNEDRDDGMRCCHEGMHCVGRGNVYRRRRGDARHDIVTTLRRGIAMGECEPEGGDTSKTCHTHRESVALRIYRSTAIVPLAVQGRRNRESIIAAFAGRSIAAFTDNAKKEQQGRAEKKEQRAQHGDEEEARGPDLEAAVEDVVSSRPSTTGRLAGSLPDKLRG